MDILLGQYKGLEAAIPMINYTEDDIQAQLHALLSGNPVRESKNGPVDNGDTAVIDYEGFKDDESKQYKPSTVGDFSGFRKVTTSENPSFKCKDNLLLDFENAVMSVTVEQFNDTDTADMEVAMKAILGNMKVEVK